MPAKALHHGTTQDLFGALGAPDDGPYNELIEPGVMLLHGRARRDEAALLAAIEAVLAQAPLRHMATPGGQRMSVAMSSCGARGWVTDRRGYRYETHDPESGQPWPAMPALLQALARNAAQEAGFADFHPDACLINEYRPGARMALHQDRDERDFAQPIVSVSLGLPATFLFGGHERRAPARRIALTHGDIVVWGGPARLRFHGVMPLKQGVHALLGERRLNLTFRRAG